MERKFLQRDPYQVLRMMETEVKGFRTLEVLTNDWR